MEGFFIWLIKYILHDEIKPDNFPKDLFIVGFILYNHFEIDQQM